MIKITLSIKDYFLLTLRGIRSYTVIDSDTKDQIIAQEHWEHWCHLEAVGNAGNDIWQLWPREEWVDSQEALARRRAQSVQERQERAAARETLAAHETRLAAALERLLAKGIARTTAESLLQGMLRGQHGALAAKLGIADLVSSSPIEEEELL